MKRAREAEDDGQWPSAYKQPRLFSDFDFTRALPVRVNSEPLLASSAYRIPADTGLSDASSNNSPDSMGSPNEMPDIDMDDGFSIIGSVSPPTPPPSNRPAKLVPSPYRGGTLLQGRTPTPTTHAFAQAALSPVRPDAFGTSDSGRMHSPLAPPPSRRFGPARDYPMPSPIRESLYSPIRDSALSLGLPSGLSPRTASLETGSPTATAHDMSRLSVSGDDMDVESGPGGPVESPTAVRMGRQRSGALFTEKKRFHLGYLDDCEKCRARVPGHHSHFLPLEP